MPADPAQAEMPVMAGTLGEQSPQRAAGVETRRHLPAVEDFDAAWPARQPPPEPPRATAPPRANRDHLPRAPRLRQDD